MGVFRRRSKESFHVGYTRGSLFGRGSIFWADARETGFDPLMGHYQIVGHTPADKITVIHESSPETFITFVDTRLGIDEFYELEISE